MSPGIAATRDGDSRERFGFRFDPRYRRAARPFGITISQAWVEVGPEELIARYGRWRLHTPLSNITAVTVTGPYRFFKTAGPPRLGVTDGGLTFASNRERGVLISFARRVKALDPTGLLRHPELTVTVAEPERLAARLRAAIGQ
ncbi:MAG: hypothetical protein ACYC91_12490 [Solirubrobacteraceae bacterium]